MVYCRSSVKEFGKLRNPSAWKVFNSIVNKCHAGRVERVCVSGEDSVLDICDSGGGGGNKRNHFSVKIGFFYYQNRK